MHAKPVLALFAVIASSPAFGENPDVADELSKDQPPSLRETEIVLTLGVAEGNPRNSEGDFVSLDDGTILFIYTRFRGGGSDHDQADLVSRTSPDGGRSWSDRDKVVVSNEAGLNVMSVSLLRLTDRRIALFYLEKNSLTDCRPVVRFSADECATWSQPVEIIPDSAVGYYVLNNDRIVQLKSGRLLAPLALHHRPDWEKPDWKGEAGVYWSDDGGSNWSRSSASWLKARDASGSRVAAQEPGVVELADGRILMWVRTDSGELYQSHSADSGATWTELSPMGVASPQSPASIERHPTSGELVMVWNDHSLLPIAGRKARTPLHLAISHDEGTSWSPPLTLESDPNGWYCYTAMEFTDSALLLAYVAGQQASGKHLSASRIRKVDFKFFPR